MEEDNNNQDVFGELDWYRGKTIEEMRSDLILLAQGKYFDNDQDYAAFTDNPYNKGPRLDGNENVSIISGFDLNDQAPEGPGPEEYKTMDDEQIVSSYITSIKKYPPIVEIKDQEAFADAILPALDNMNNVAQYSTTGKGTKDDPMGSKIEYDEGMLIATEMQTGAILDYVKSGFRNTGEFYEWYLSDLSNLQVVMQPGQKQAEDFSIVDAGFYDNEEPFVDPMPVPNTKFPRRPDDEISNLGLTEGNMNVPATPDVMLPELMLNVPSVNVPPCNAPLNVPATPPVSDPELILAVPSVNDPPTKCNTLVFIDLT